MKAVVTKLTDWDIVREMARFTQGKENMDTEVTEKFKRKMLVSEHSPLRAYIFKVQLYDIPSFVSTHLVRHKIGAEHFVCTSRPDIVDSLPRHEQRKDDPCNHSMVVNAAELLEISRKRLCTRAEAETQKVWKLVFNEVRDIDPVLSEYMRPQCVRLGFCPEGKRCGMLTYFEEDRDELYI